MLNTVNGKGICPRGHPLSVGGSPCLPSLRDALAKADVVLAICTELGETDYDLLMAGGLPDTSTWIRIDIDPVQTRIPTPCAIGITSDAGLAVDALIEKAERPLQGATAGAARARALRKLIRAETHFHPEMMAFFDTIRSALPDVVLVGDSTRPTYYAAWQYECDAPRRYFHSVSGFGTLGYALPAALGARCADPAGPVVALIGDGGIQFTLAELSTGAQASLAVPVIVWNNNGYGEIENSMLARNVPATHARITAPDFAAAAAAHHCGYANPTSLAALHSALAAAVKTVSPTLIEVRESDFLTTPGGQWYP